jgi:hypothetical protein
VRTASIKRANVLVPSDDNSEGFEFEKPTKERFKQKAVCENDMHDNFTSLECSKDELDGSDDDVLKMGETEAGKRGIDKRHYERMTNRGNQKKCIIYPENKHKSIWDLFMTIVLIMTCVMTPLSIAFNDLDNVDKKS